MAAYSNIPGNRFGFLGSRSATNPVIDSDSRTGPVSSYFADGNGESYLMTVETTVKRVTPPAMPAGSYEVARDRPQIVSEFPKMIQTEVSQPAWPPAMYQSPYGFPRASSAFQFGPTTHVDFTNGMPRSQFGTTTHVDFTNGMLRSVTEPGSVTQSQVTPPTIRMTPAPLRPNAKISQAMNDIAEATEYLKELARPSIPNNNTITVPQNTVPSPASVNNTSAPPVTIDSREAARRYKNVIVSMEPYGKEGSIPMLDSKTAKEKYRGVFV